MRDENAQSLLALDSLPQNDEAYSKIVAMVALANHSSHGFQFLFQNFSRGQIIKKGRSLFGDKDDYDTFDKTVLVLANSLSAVFRFDLGQLIFNSFRVANTFLPLLDFNEEASEAEIRSILSHPRLAPEDVDALARGANQWFRTRFAMLRTSGVLDDFEPQEIRDFSEGYEVDVLLDGDKLFVPADRNGARRLLEFLNEERFLGPLTKRVYRTNSKLPAD